MSVEKPQIRYARRDGVNIAYCRWGRGPIALFVPPLAGNLDVFWDLPEMARTLQRGGRVLDVIMFDKRGTGLSDRSTGTASMETHAQDALAILDQEGVDKAAIMGISEGGLIALVIAVMAPDRISRIVTQGTPAMGASYDDLLAAADDHNPPPTQEEVGDMFRGIIREWATGSTTSLDIGAPGASNVPHIRTWNERYERQSASPGAIRDHLRAHAGFEIRPYASRVTCPVLVAHARDDRLVHSSNGRLLASWIEDAEHLEFEGDAHLWWITNPDWATLQDRFDGFLLGAEVDRGTTRTFGTVLFTDIVNSTVRAQVLGDAGWRRLIELHDSITRSAVESNGGIVVKTTGDGVVATFPDPEAAMDAATRLMVDLSASDIEVRAGLHVGRYETRADGDISGITVNIAARVEGRAEAGQLLVTQAVHDVLLGSTYRFDDAGEQSLKGVEGSWRLWQWARDPV